MQATAKPTHWAYAAIEDPKGDLCQGDIIEPSEEIRSALNKVHPYFTDDKYIAFLVLTQSCDLKRRDGKPCRSRYINVAAIRPLADVMSTLLGKVCERVSLNGEPIEDVYISETKQKAEQLLERIFNQNAHAEGLFYLYPDAGAGITEHAVALVQVSVAFREHDHYKELVTARCGRLNDQFQSKLGWLIGNLFSRIAAREWEADKLHNMIDGFLAEKNNIHGCELHWVPRGKVRTARKKGVDPAEMGSIKDLVNHIKRQRGRPKEIAVEQVLAITKRVIPNLRDVDLNTLESQLSVDSVFDSACK